MNTMKNAEYFNELHEAVKNGDIKRIRLIDNIEEFVNGADNDGNTALHYAINCSDLEIVQYLLWKNANPNIPNMKGWTSVHISCIRGNDACFDMLISRDGDVDSMDANLNRPGHFAAIHGNYILLQNIIGLTKELSAKDGDGCTMLHKASLHGRITCVHLLIDAGFRIDLTNNIGQTSLHLAAMEGHLPVVKYLLSKMKNWITFMEARDDFGETALMLASRFLKKETVAYLKQLEWCQKLSTDPNDIDSIQYPGHFAARVGDIKQLTHLLDHGNIKVDECDRNGSTLLHLVTMYGHSECLILLLKYGADVKLRNKNSETAYDVAKRCGRSECLQILNNSAKKVSENENENDERKIAGLVMDKRILPRDFPFDSIGVRSLSSGRRGHDDAKIEAFRRVEVIEKYRSIAELDYLQLGGSKEEIRNLQRKYNNIKDDDIACHLEYEKCRREILESKLDLCQKEIKKLKKLRQLEPEIPRKPEILKRPTRNVGKPSNIKK